METTSAVTNLWHELEDVLHDLLLYDTYIVIDATLVFFRYKYVDSPAFIVTYYVIHTTATDLYQTFITFHYLRVTFEYTGICAT